MLVVLACSIQLGEESTELSVVEKMTLVYIDMTSFAELEDIFYDILLQAVNIYTPICCFLQYFPVLTFPQNVSPM